MINLEKATGIVQRELAEHGASAGLELALLNEYTLEFDYGWLFFYNSKAYVDARDDQYLIGGNAPIIVDKYSGRVVVTGTRQSEEEYLRLYCLYRDDITRFKAECLK